MGEKSFFEALFDFSFSSFITTRIIKLLYGLAIFFSGVAAIIFFVNAFRMSAAFGILALLVSPLIFLLWVCACRVSLELVIVIFRIAENTGKMAGVPQQPGSDLPPPPEPSLDPPA